jgi:hypothetical protein
VPCEQQLLSQFSGLLRLPPGGISKYHDDWWLGAEPRHSRFPDDRISVRELPPDNDLVRWRIQPRRDRFSADERACQRSLQPLPHQWELFTEYRADGLRERAVPFDGLAEYKQSSALLCRRRFRGDELFHLPYNDRLDCRVVRS